MSQDIERETTASTAWSIVGAFAGLGVGFLFLFLAVGAVTYHNSKVLRPRPKASRVLMETLDSDFLTVVPKTVEVHDGGRKLKLFIKKPHVGKPIKVAYFVKDTSSGVLISRHTYQKTEEVLEVAKLAKGSFQLRGAAAIAEWAELDQPDTVRRRTWGVDRWSVGSPKP